jgi:hypothetical protein
MQVSCGVAAALNSITALLLEIDTHMCDRMVGCQLCRCNVVRSSHFHSPSFTCRAAQ